MNKSIDVYEAKTQLAKLLDSVSRGERITITKNGRPIAMLVPAEPERPDLPSVIERMNELRRGNVLSGITIQELVEEGRKS